MDKIFSNKHIIKPPVLISSLKPERSRERSINNVENSGSSSPIETPTAIEYFGSKANLSFLSPPSKKRKISIKDDLLNYLKKRDKKLLKQNETMIFLMQQSLIQEGVNVNRSNIDSEDSDHEVHSDDD